jgi:hypothetical protein
VVEGFILRRGLRHENPAVRRFALLSLLKLEEKHFPYLEDYLITGKSYVSISPSETLYLPIITTGSLLKAIADGTVNKGSVADVIATQCSQWMLRYYNQLPEAAKVGQCREYFVYNILRSTETIFCTQIPF